MTQINTDSTGVVEVSNWRSCCASCRTNYLGNNTCVGCGARLKFAVNVSSGPDSFIEAFAKDNDLEFRPS